MAKKSKKRNRPSSVPRLQPERPVKAAGPAPAPRLDQHRCEQFLQHEAHLLDEGKFDEWLALFTPEAWYWVPSEPDQRDPFETVSLIYDDRRLLETRVRRLASPRMYSQEPRSRTSRIVSNVTVEGTLSLPTFLREQVADGKDCVVRSKFMMIEYRRGQQRLFGGTMVHGLVHNSGRIFINWKRVYLVNCDAPLDGITVPF